MFDLSGAICLVSLVESSSEVHNASSVYQLDITVIGSNFYSQEPVRQSLQTRRSTRQFTKGDLVKSKRNFSNKINNLLIDLQNSDQKFRNYPLKLSLEARRFFETLVDPEMSRFIEGIAEEYESIRFNCEDLEIPWEVMYFGNYPSGYFLFEKALVCRDVANSPKESRDASSVSNDFTQEAATCICETVYDLPFFKNSNPPDIDALNARLPSFRKVADIADCLHDFKNTRTNFLVSHGNSESVKIGNSTFTFEDIGLSLIHI